MSSIVKNSVRIYKSKRLGPVILTRSVIFEVGFERESLCIQQPGIYQYKDFDKFKIKWLNGLNKVVGMKNVVQKAKVAEIAKIVRRIKLIAKKK